MSKSEECDGMVVALEGPSRYDFAHEVPPVSASRVSLTWRWFDEEFLQQLQQREANLRKKKGEIGMEGISESGIPQGDPKSTKK